MRRTSGDGFSAFVAVWFVFIVLLNLAWMGLLAWAIIRLVSHFAS